MLSPHASPLHCATKTRQNITNARTQGQLGHQMRLVRHAVRVLASCVFGGRFIAVRPRMALDDGLGDISAWSLVWVLHADPREVADEQASGRLHRHRELYN